jgi:hypothetical protein
VQALVGFYDAAGLIARRRAHGGCDQSAETCGVMFEFKRQEATEERPPSAVRLPEHGDRLYLRGDAAWLDVIESSAVTRTKPKANLPSAGPVSIATAMRQPARYGAASTCLNSDGP